MGPKIISKKAFLVAGVSGGGDETARAWDAFMKITKMHPLKNQVGEEGYEIRMYSTEADPGEMHVGVAVKDANVPAEYKVVAVPAFKYAEFEIQVAKGYGSSNTAMNRWLQENEKVYQQGKLGSREFAIEVYDKRYKGEKDPSSIVGIILPLKEIREGKHE